MHVTFEQHVFCFVISQSCILPLRISLHAAVFLWSKSVFARPASRSLHHMAPTFNPHVPKRGRNRQVIKRPASTNNKDWKRVPYVRHLEADEEAARAMDHDDS